MLEILHLGYLAMIRILLIILCKALFLVLVFITIPTDAKKDKTLLKQLAKALGFKLEKKLEKVS